jgi:hypothetical protein
MPWGANAASQANAARTSTQTYRKIVGFMTILRHGRANVIDIGSLDSDRSNSNSPRQPPLHDGTKDSFVLKLAGKLGLGPNGTGPSAINGCSNIRWTAVTRRLPAAAKYGLMFQCRSARRTQDRAFGRREYLGRRSSLPDLSAINEGGEADLRLLVTDNPDPVVRNRILTYTLTVENEEPGAVDSVDLKASLIGDMVGSATTSNAGLHRGRRRDQLCTRRTCCG